jgi:FMN phosphatase YigB (HAD superfamily)
VQAISVLTDFGILDLFDAVAGSTLDQSRAKKEDVILYALDLAGAPAPEDCLMVGNDATEDMIAQTIGMKVFLLTDCLINKNNLDLSGYPQGNFDSLLDYIQSM